MDPYPNRGYKSKPCAKTVAQFLALYFKSFPGEKIPRKPDSKKVHSSLEGDIVEVTLSGNNHSLTIRVYLDNFKSVCGYNSFSVVKAEVSSSMETEIKTLGPDKLQNIRGKFSGWTMPEIGKKSDLKDLIEAARIEGSIAA